MVLFAAVLLLLAPLAQPAGAHGRGSDATNLRSRVLETPPLDGVTFRVRGGDDLLELRNDGDGEVLVLGYEGEPYLRVGVDGVFENLRSPATHLNDDRYVTATAADGSLPVPAEVDADADPVWRQRSSGSRAAWHDHRIHYMAPGRPPQVTDPAVETVVFARWEVPVVAAGEGHVVAGDLRWIPGPSPLPWLGVAAVLVVPALVGLRSGRGGGGAADGERALARPAAAVLGVVILLNLPGLVDDVVAVPLPLPAVLSAAGQTAAFLAVAAFGAVRGWRGGDGAFTALGVGAAALLLGQGLLAWPALSASQLATVFPDALSRTAVAASLLQALPVGVVAVIGSRRLLPPADRRAVPAAEGDGKIR
jgi:hypothetical protein